MTVGSRKGTFEKYHLKVSFKQAKELYTAKHAGHCPFLRQLSITITSPGITLLLQNHLLRPVEAANLPCLWKT